MSQHPPTPPGVTGYDENSTIPEHAMRDPGIDPLHGVELEVNKWVLAAKGTMLFHTVSTWSLDVLKTGVMGGKAFPAAASCCFSPKGIFPAIGSAMFYAGITTTSMRTAEKYRLGSLASTGLMLAPILALPIMVPLEMTKRQYQFNQIKDRMGVTRQAILAKHGWKGLMVGYKPFLAMQSTFIACYALPQLLPYNRDMCWHIGSGLFMLSYLLVQPLDVLANRAMLGQSEGRTMLQDAKVLGVRGLRQGFGARCFILIALIIAEEFIGNRILIQSYKLYKLAKLRDAEQDLPDPVHIKEYDMTEDIEEDDLIAELLGKDKARRIKEGDIREETLAGALNKRRMG